LGQEREAVHGIGRMTRAIAEGPAALVANGIDHRHRDDVLQPEQAPHDDRAVRPGTRQGNVQVVAAGLGGEARPAVRRDAVLEDVLLAHESAPRADLRRRWAHRPTLPLCVAWGCAPAPAAVAL